MADALRVPPSHRGEILRLGEFSDEDFQGLMRALDTAPNFAPFHVLIPVVHSATGLNNDESARLLATLLSVAEQLKLPSWDATRVATEIGSASYFELDEPSRAKLISRLEQILNLSTLTTSSQATDIATDHEHVFADARIFTELRPLFEEDPETAPGGAVIFHMLKVQHQTNGRFESTYIALDDQDLETLGRTVTRALAKQESLRLQLKQSGIQLFDPNEEDGSLES